MTGDQGDAAGAGSVLEPPPEALLNLKGYAAIKAGIPLRPLPRRIRGRGRGHAVKGQAGESGAGRAGVGTVMVVDGRSVFRMRVRRRLATTRLKPAKIWPATGVVVILCRACF